MGKTCENRVSLLALLRVRFGDLPEDFAMRLQI